jgi:peptidoglycan/xylan/chitin deacetylase (PgdA/CDA1 family)
MSLSLSKFFFYIRSLFPSVGIILMYHRVAEIQPDPWGLCVTPNNFAQHMQVLKKFGCPLNLGELSQYVKNDRLPRRWFSVTFDDGYADNYENAKPILENYDIPATFFLSTGILGGAREFWWDELEKILLQPGQLPETLHLNISGKEYRWNLGASSRYTKEDLIRDTGWKAENGKQPTPRHTIYLELHQLLKPLPSENRVVLQDKLLDWAGLSSTGRSYNRPMSLEEVLSLAKSDLIEIGAHSVSHANLPPLPVEMQRHEVVYSKAVLEDLTGYSMRCFSYPYGSFAPETFFVVRDAGFLCACTVLEGIVDKHSEILLLPRIMVRNMDGGAFGRFLSHLSNGFN